MSVDIFKRAAKSKLRFDTRKGSIAVEDLWDLPLSSKGQRISLDELAIALNQKIKDAGETSFVSDAPAVDPQVTLAFEVVKEVIAVKLADAKTAALTLETKQKKARIREIIAGKKDEALGASSIAELEKMLED